MGYARIKVAKGGGGKETGFGLANKKSRRISAAWDMFDFRSKKKKAEPESLYETYTPNESIYERRYVKKKGSL